MIQATQIRAGMVLEHEGKLCRVLSIMHITPGNKRGKVQVEMRRLRDGIKLETRFRSEESVERAVLNEKEMEFLYLEGDLYYFMDHENYEQIHLKKEDLGNAVYYLTPNTQVKVLMHEQMPLGIEIPPLMEQVIVDTEPTMKGATAARGMKPAKLGNGLTIKVPQFVQVGDKVRVDTTSNEYSERV